MASIQDLVRALAKADRLEFLAHLDDSVWEVVGGGPLGRYAVSAASRLGDEVALNPQPLPPAEAGRLAMIGLTRGIIVIGGRGDNPVERFLEIVDDWCGTGWPKHWPWPWPDPDPDPQPDWQTGVMLGAGLTAARLALHYPEGDLRSALEKASQQLLETALG